MASWLEDKAWYGERVCVWWAWRYRLPNSVLVGPVNTQCHSARLSVCQAQRAAARPNQWALIQPATGSPLHPFFFQALPVATTTPSSVRAHTHTLDNTGFNYDKLAKS